jgi:hypothetical protein
MWSGCHSRIGGCPDSKSGIKNVFGFRARDFCHSGLALGRILFSCCGADPSRAKKRAARANPGYPKAQTQTHRAAPGGCAQQPAPDGVSGSRQPVALRGAAFGGPGGLGPLPSYYQTRPGFYGFLHILPGRAHKGSGLATSGQRCCKNPATCTRRAHTDQLP